MTKTDSDSHLDYVFHFDGRIVGKSITEIENHGPSGPLLVASIGIGLSLADVSRDNVAWLPVSQWKRDQEQPKSEPYDSIRVGEVVFGIMTGAVKQHVINYRNGLPADAARFFYLNTDRVMEQPTILSSEQYVMGRIERIKSVEDDIFGGMKVKAEVKTGDKIKTIELDVPSKDMPAKLKNNPLAWYQIIGNHYVAGEVKDLTGHSSPTMISAKVFTLDELFTQEHSLGAALYGPERAPPYQNMWDSYKEKIAAALG